MQRLLKRIKYVIHIRTGQVIEVNAKDYNEALVQAYNKRPAFMAKNHGFANQFEFFDAYHKIVYPEDVGLR